MSRPVLPKALRLKLWRQVYTAFETAPDSALAQYGLCYAIRELQGQLSFHYSGYSDEADRTLVAIRARWHDAWAPYRHQAGWSPATAELRATIAALVLAMIAGGDI